ncbi:MAG TPA: hypothetical protein VJ623_13185 [Holophagaceae bacterium]|nr:hypothetical protein [Holophagaceae bacterium]
MTTRVQEQIQTYFDAQPEPKRAELAELHRAILALQPDAQLWFLDGTDATGKVVTNPNVGYGVRPHTAGGKTRPFYRVGLSATTSGISVYVMGLEDKTHLARTYGADLGKAKVTGYCIAFKSLKAIQLPVLLAAIAEGLGRRDPSAPLS